MHHRASPRPRRTSRSPRCGEAGRSSSNASAARSRRRARSCRSSAAAAAARPTPGACSSRSSRSSSGGAAADEVIARLRRKLAQVPGVTLFLQAVQDVRSAARTSNAVPVHAAERGEPRRARTPGRRGCSRKLRKLSRAHATSPATSRTAACRRRSSSTATPRRGSASRRRPSTTRSTTRSASARSRRSTPQLQPVPRRPRGGPSFQQNPDALERHLRAVRRPARRCRSRAHRALRARPHAALRQPPGPVPVGHALVQPRARRRRWARPSTSSRTPSARLGCRATIHATFPGHGAGLPGLARQPAAADPGRAGRRLHRARHALRELHPPDHDPVDAAVGGRRRAARAPARSAPSSASSRSSASSC